MFFVDLWLELILKFIIWSSTMCGIQFRSYQFLLRYQCWIKYLLRCPLPKQSDLLSIFLVLSFANLRNHLRIDNHFYSLSINIVLCQTVFQQIFKNSKVIFSPILGCFKIWFPSSSISYKLIVIWFELRLQFFSHLPSFLNKRCIRITFALCLYFYLLYQKVVFFTQLSKLLFHFLRLLL